MSAILAFDWVQVISELCEDREAGDKLMLAAVKFGGRVGVFELTTSLVKTVILSMSTFLGGQSRV